LKQKGEEHYCCRTIKNYRRLDQEVEKHCEKGEEHCCYRTIENYRRLDQEVGKTLLSQNTKTIE